LRKNTLSIINHKTWGREEINSKKGKGVPRQFSEKERRGKKKRGWTEGGGRKEDRKRF